MNLKRLIKKLLKAGYYPYNLTMIGDNITTEPPSGWHVPTIKDRKEIEDYERTRQADNSQPQKG